MAKMTEYMRGFEDGLDLAVRITRKNGLHGLEDEIKYRNITGFHTKMPKQDMNNLTYQVKDKLMSHLMVLVFAAVHDEFGFGEKRCQRFMDGLNRGADYLLEDLATWDDYIQAIKEETGLKLEIRWK